MYRNWIYEKLIDWRLSPELAEPLAFSANLLIIVLIVTGATIYIRSALIGLCTKWIERKKYKWDDLLLKHGLFTKLSWFVPLLFIHLSIDAFLPPETSVYLIFKRITKVLFIIVAVPSINAALSSFSDIYHRRGNKRPELLQGFIDAGKIVAYVIGTIFIIATITGTSPWGIMSVLGGLTAVTMLVFKDTILGFTASIQLSSIDMIRIGDWVEMPSYGADGDVISMSIHTVRVQNWDKTITTIPTYALVSNSFKNWRGMKESGGRRIKRSIYIDINSIRFCNNQMLEKFNSYQLLSDYLKKKTEEINTYNHTMSAGLPGNAAINTRRQTNIGIFRAYIISYLKNNPLIHQDMTFLVRQLAPTENGLPLEIYVFSKEQRWACYEALQADIFDHLLASLPEFELRAFQNPTGFDIQQIRLSQQTGRSS